MQNKNLVPARQESKLPVTGEDQLSLCLSEPKIKSLTELEPLKEVLRYAMVLVGLRSQNWPTDEEKALLLRFIISHYGGHTPSEIKLAFNLAVSGKLDFKDGEGVNCYENFSVVYFSSIMNAYRRWASQTIKHLPKEQPKELPAPEVSDIEFIEAVRRHYQSHQDFRLLPSLAYKVLGLQLTNDEKEAVKQAVKHLISDPTNDDFKKYAVKQYLDRLP